MSEGILSEVFRVIEDRRDRPREGSYVSSLLSAGLPKVIEKVREESEELVEAAMEGGKSEVIHEAADLIFHVMVLLAARGVTIEDVFEELRRRRR